MEQRGERRKEPKMKETDVVWPREGGTESDKIEERWGKKKKEKKERMVTPKSAHFTQLLSITFPLHGLRLDQTRLQYWMNFT